MPTCKKVTPLLAIIVFVAIFLFCIVMCFVHDTNTFEESKLKLFIALLSGLGVIITFFFYYSIVELQQTQQKLTVIQETSRITSTVYYNLSKEIRKYEPKIPVFCTCLFYNTESSVDENPVYKRLLSATIFASWSEVLKSEDFIDVSQRSYIALFLQFSSSKLLEEEWMKVRLNYDDDLLQFGDKLFLYAKNRVDHNFSTLAQEFLRDGDKRST